LETTSIMDDHIDRLCAQWCEELPDLDTTPVQVFGRIYRISQLIAPGIEDAMRKHGLDRGEFDVLATLRRQGQPYRLTPTELYSALLIASGSLTHRLGRLEKAGLVSRVACERDGRSLSAQLTERGRKTVEAAYREDLVFEARLLKGMSKKSQHAMSEMLRQLLQTVEDTV
jgi:DNA-binding MarR family transcriptional regulator